MEKLWKPIAKIFKAELGLASRGFKNLGLLTFFTVSQQLESVIWQKILSEKEMTSLWLHLAPIIEQH